MAETNGAAASELFDNEELWRHPDPKSTQMWSFLEHVNKDHNTDLKDYHSLYQWSVENVAPFWSHVWHFTGIRSSKPFDKVVDHDAPMYPRPPFFQGAALNFAENLLFPASSPDPASPAILSATESARETVTWSELRQRVQACKASLQALGITKGDRVAGYVGNHANTVIFALAAIALGAIWTGVSPDSGVGMVLDRLKQIGPKLLVADASQEYNGKRHDVMPKVRDVVKDLESLQTVVILPETPEKSALDAVKPSAGKAYSLGDFLALEEKDTSRELAFEQLPPDHPIYILYSSGTTGAPKCIVHGAIGTLIQHKKEHAIQGDIKPGDRLFYFTTCTWMMWHWLVSGLASGATIVLFDGSPMRYKSESPDSSTPDELAMPRLISELNITQFGTSAKYLSILEQKNLMSKEAPHNIKLPTLRAIYNTASPLAPSTFRYVYKAFGPDIHLASITGGTDIVSLFGAPSTLNPVFAGEVQVPGLGMAVRAFASESPNDNPSDVTASGSPGDLVCVRPFPCQPVAFWPLGTGPGTGSQKYESSYFARFRVDGKPVWHHGDFIAFNPRTGGLLMLGRSDGVLNPAGVRFGSAEIYNVLLKRFAGRVADGLCVGRRRQGEADETVCLFVKMEEGQAFGETLAKEIRSAVREELSPRHVPPVVDECPDIPVTVNGKKVEGAVRQILSGSKVKTSASVANAESLDFYQKWAEEHQ